MPAMRSKAATEVGLHLGRTALEKTNLAQTNDQAVGLAAHGDFLARDFRRERGLEFGLQFGQIAVFFAGLAPSEPSGRDWRCGPGSRCAPCFRWLAPC
jgi:hypothetical protein